ncbi:hypothetical protein CBM2599_B51319 [Cupriavidus taiwanensis]|nr:hypothetical protein CBM2599_B51319 [Cupriavidus taiwanensis]SOZ00313.1 hypothetical protein CBM2600_B70330 [Cupriavidus taiwanensis]
MPACFMNPYWRGISHDRKSALQDAVLQLLPYWVADPVRTVWCRLPFAGFRDGIAEAIYAERPSADRAGRHRAG